MTDNENKRKTFRSQIGIDATVRRESVRTEDGRRANAQLREIGTSMNPTANGGLRYLGSLATHIYWNETLAQVAFVTQAGSTLDNVPETLAQAATKDLIGTVMERYGQRRPTWRSGF